MEKQLITGLAILPFLIACQKEMSISPDNLRPAGTGNGVLAKSVEKWSNQDSLVTEYTYNDNKKLVAATSLSGWGKIIYHRDDSGNITQMEKITNNEVERLANVVYDGSGDKVSYILNQSGAIVLDSTAFYYHNGNVVKTEVFVPGGAGAVLNSYNEWSYAPDGNLSKLKVFVRTSNGNIVPDISYDFEYDGKVNPFYSPDDARIVENWYIVASPNNLIKQTNHYNGTGEPDDYVVLKYEYETGNKPLHAARNGPANDTNQVASSFFYE